MKSLTRISCTLSFVLLAFPFSRGFAQSVALSANAVTAVSGGSASIATSIANSGGAQPTSVEWTLAYPANAISTVTVTPGAAAVAAGKTVTCAPAAGSLLCIAYGMNSNPFPNGDIADANFSLAPSFTSGSAAIQVGGSIAASVAGSAIPSTVSSGAITIASGSLSSLICSPTNVNGPGSLTCQVAISAPAPAGGLAIAISSNSTTLTLPTSLTIPAGSTSASFSGTASASATSQTIVITVAANGTAQSATVTLAAAPLVVSALSCSPANINTPGSLTCQVAISAPAPAGGLAIAISSNSANLTLPTSLTISAGSTSASFSGTASASATSETVVITVAANGTSQSTTVTLAAAPLVSALSCTPTSLVSNETATCGVTISQPAAASVLVQLASNVSILTIPASVSIPAGSSSASFTASTGVIGATQPATITASLNNQSASITLSLVVPPPLSDITCVPAVVLNGASAQCAVFLTSAAPPGGAAINLVSTNAAVEVPSIVTIASGNLSATFSAVTVASATDQMAWITATGDGSSKSLWLLAAHAPSMQLNLLLRGQASETSDTTTNGPPETSGTTNGASVTPSASLPQLTGNVVVNGAGSVNFTPARAGVGVFFENCCANTDNAYYKFTGASVGSIFNAAQGEVSFYLTSRYTFAQRTANAATARYAFDVRDANGHLFGFNTQVMSGSLIFSYMIDGTGLYYYVPSGTEDALFGDGVSMKVTLTWNGNNVGNNMSLYLNDALTSSGPYPTYTPNWTDASLLDFGAYEYLTYGGYFALDDAISDFVVTGPS
jgi:trimeric autotransporter adhesin